jgi:hypothetical protein
MAPLSLHAAYKAVWGLEARSGIEPLYTALQAAASPLCHLAGKPRNLAQAGPRPPAIT